MRAAGELEAAVMEAVWAATTPLTVREILDAVNSRLAGRPLAYTTVLTVVKNLHDKQMLDCDPRERAFRYAAATSRDEYTAQLMSRALDGTPDRTSALLHFATTLSEAERAALARSRKSRRPR